MAAHYKVIRSLKRGLLVLEALNEVRSATACELSTSLKLPRATVHRLLQTLVDEGFVYNVPSSESFCLSGHVRQLGSHYDEIEMMVEVAGRPVSELSDEILWPIDLAVPHKSNMVLRMSTHRTSPKTFYPNTSIGDSVPYISSAPGRAYLACLSDEECFRVLRRSVQRVQRKTQLGSIPIFGVLEQVRRCGFGFRREGPLPKTSAIAVPLKISNRAIGCLNVMFFTSAMTIADAAKIYLPRLKETVRIIESRMEHRCVSARP